MELHQLNIRIKPETYENLARQAEAEHDPVGHHARKWLSVISLIPPKDTLRARKMIEAAFGTPTAATQE